MSNYIRAQFNHPDDIYFLTLVTKDRLQHFSIPQNQKLAVEILLKRISMQEGELIAWVVMPDHIHILVRQGKNSFSHMIRQFKREMNALILGKDGTIWQPRFWEHRIRNENDLKKHLDYIHANPVHAGLAENQQQYAASSFLLWMEKGEYTEGWSLPDLPTIPWDGGNPCRPDLSA